MPELPEVETTRLGLLPLLGKVVQSVEIRYPTLRWPIPKHLKQTLPNQTLHSLTRRAKYILCGFDTGTLLLHLGMSGRIQLLDRNYPPEKHDHFDIQFSDAQVLRLRDPRRFGAVLWLDNHHQNHSLLNQLGPEPLEASFNANDLHHTFKNKTLAVKNAVMDGHVVVGVGNIYASESLFRARIHPETPAKNLTLKQCERLWQKSKIPCRMRSMQGVAACAIFLAPTVIRAIFSRSILFMAAQVSRAKFAQNQFSAFA